MAHTTARGYGHRHQQLRKRWAPIVAAGGVLCARCGQPILPGELWDLGHDDVDRRVYTGPEHRARCNRSAGGQEGNRRRWRRPRQHPPQQRTSRRWL
jgi:hypothetical protein